MATHQKRADGYSLIELLIATVFFTIIAGSIFSLLLSTQLRYTGESGLTTAFQQANVVIDQITRDVHSAGYPSPSSLAVGVAANFPNLVALPFAWSPGYPNTPCTVNVDCGAIPGDYDLMLETDTGDGNGVQWIRYSLQGTTLMRGMTPKIAFADPVASTSAGVMLPYLENVMNGPGNKSLPIFSYVSVPPGKLSTSNITQVNIMLIVQSAHPDPQTGQFRTITLTGQAALFN